MSTTWNTDEAQFQIQICVDKITDEVVDAIHKGGMYVQAEVQKIAPVDTGTYKSRIRTEEPVVTEKNVVVAVGSDIPYALRLEFGYVGPDKLGRTYHQKAQPHWRPVFDLSAPAIQAFVAKAARAGTEGV